MAPITIADLPDPGENPAAWFSGLAMVPSADGGPSIAERLAIPGGSLWWLVDYWCYEGGYTGVSLPRFIADSAAVMGQQKRRLMDAGKRWREKVRCLIPSGVDQTRQGGIVLVTQSSYRGRYRTAQGSREGDIHLGPVLDVLEQEGRRRTILERDTGHSLGLRHPWKEESAPRL